MKKFERGITLIALVITIIVLLILAGVTINMLTGDNGVLKQAENAKEKHIAGGEQEMLSLAFSDSKTEKILGEIPEITSEVLKNKLTQMGYNVEVKDGTGDTAGKIEVTFKDTGNKYVVDKDGNIEDGGSDSNTGSDPDPDTGTGSGGYTGSEVLTPPSTYEYCINVGYSESTPSTATDSVKAYVIKNSDDTYDIQFIGEGKIISGSYWVSEFVGIYTDDGYTRGVKYKGTIKNVKISYGIENIVLGMFYKCEDLESVTIPNSISEIEEYAFYDCNMLKNLRIPGSITEIASFAFYCDGLEEITISGRVTGIEYDAFRYDYYANHYTQLNKVVIIDDMTGNISNALSTFRNASTVILEDTVTQIEEYAFSGYTNLSTITIPQNVASIGNKAFYGCTSLNNVTIPDSVLRVGKDAYHNTGWYNNHADGDMYLNKVYYGYKGTIASNTQIIIKSGTITIADYALGVDYSAYNYGFSNAYANITGIDLNTQAASTLRSVGNKAFSGIKNVTTITVPDNVTNMGDSVFDGWTSAQSINVPFTEGNKPENWDSNWTGYNDFNANIVYKSNT